MTTYDVVDVFMKNVLKIHAWPTKIIDDWDPKFLSEFWTTLFNMCGTKIICTTCFKGEILWYPIGTLIKILIDWLIDWRRMMTNNILMYLACKHMVFALELDNSNMELKIFLWNIFVLELDNSIYKIWIGVIQPSMDR